MNKLKFLVSAALILVVAAPASAQQSQQQSSQQTIPTYQPGAGQPSSLGDTARKIRAKSHDTVRVNPDEAKELFSSVDEIYEFAAKDTGFPKQTAPKRQMLTKAQFEKRVNDSMAEAVNADRIEQSAVVLKKFGFLPPDFDLKKTLAEGETNGTGAFYDPRDKTMYLLNWISIDEQKPIIAHELTHALQDSTYNLQHWMKTGRTEPTKPTMSVPANYNDEASIARRAVVEGQAMLVYVDYLLRARNVNLADNLGLADVVRNNIKGYDENVTLRDAPMLLRDSATFPYDAGFEFELDLLRKGGRPMCYNTVFANPPISTHEVFEPEAYFERRKRTFVRIPDLSSVLSDKYAAYDTGSLGELDVQSFVKQYGRENDVYSVARKWNGGAYVAVQRKDRPADKPLTPADVAFVYYSRWDTNKAAKRFAELFVSSVSKRVEVKQKGDVTEKDCGYGKACEGLLWSQKLQTADGPVVIEIYGDNTMLITDSFEEATVNKLRPLLQNANKGTAALEGAPQKELSMKLMEIPAFRRLSEEVGEQILRSIH